MTTIPQIHLPPELVHAVLIRMEDWGENGLVKCGLASCSLTCHHWAALIRPLLFKSLTLRSREDVSQLVAFVDSDSLQPMLSGCISKLNVVEDQVSAKFSWSHQLMRLNGRLPRIGIHHWTVKGAPAASDGQRLLERRSSLPFVALPRAFPRSILAPVTFLTLSGLSLRSVWDLVRFVGHQTSCEYLVLGSITFADGTIEGIGLRQERASRSVLKSIRMEDGLQDHDAIQRWIKTSNILFASQGCMRLDDTTLTLVGNYLNLLLSHYGNQNQTQRLEVARSSGYGGGYFRS